MLLWSDIELLEAVDEALGHALTAFCELVVQWPDAQLPGMVVLALNLRHPAEPSPACRDRALQLFAGWKAAADAGGFMLARMGSLPPVRAGDLDAWAGLPVVQRVLSGRDIEPLRDQLQDPLRMKPFAKVCNEWLGQTTSDAVR